DGKQPGFGDPFQEAAQNPLPVAQTDWERLNTGSKNTMINEALKRDFEQRTAQANLYHQNWAQIEGLLHHINDPNLRDATTGKSTVVNPQTGKVYTDDEIQQLELQREHTLGQYEKLVGVDKQSKDALQKARGIIDFVRGHRRAQMAQPPTAPNYP